MQSMHYHSVPAATFWDEWDIGWGGGGGRGRMGGGGGQEGKGEKKSGAGGKMDICFCNPLGKWLRLWLPMCFDVMLF